jgi:serine/threonine-protein kinase HipA
MMTRRLDVFLGAEIVGALEQDSHGALWFSYDAAWLEAGKAVPLSASLPLRKERFHSRECRPFFAGLLPEEMNRQRLAERFGVSERNDFALLERIGAECAGAVAMLPPGEAPQSGAAHYQALDGDELERKLESLPRSPLLAGEDGIRLSLAGAQGKAVLAMRDGRFYLPLEGSPSTHILKPDSAIFPGLVENEFFCMELASMLRMRAAEVKMDQAGAVRFLRITRYDRAKREGGGWVRIHQEDFCQALGVAPELKYQGEGGPGLKDCFELVRSHSTAPAADMLRLFDAVVFNFLIGNNDAHGKNFSFLREGREIRLAPLYDLVSTELYPELSGNMAMKIGRAKRAIDVSPKDWLAFFQEAGVGATLALQRMKKLAKMARERSEWLAEQVPLAAGIAGIVERRAITIQQLHAGGQR